VEVLLTIATILGGIAAIWYFWDKWADRAKGGGALRWVPSGHSAVVYAQSRAYGVLMGENVAAAREAVERGGAGVAAAFAAHGGKLRGARAGSVVAFFPGADRALAAALTAREARLRANGDLPPDQRVHYRFGIERCAQGDNAADAVARAALLAAGAQTDGIHISEALRASLGARGEDLHLSAVDAGSYALIFGADAGGKRAGPVQLEALDLPLPVKPSIVLLPFAAPDDDAQSQAFATGLRLDIQNALVKMSGLFLIAAGSANAFRGVPAVEAAARLGVRYVLEGGVQRLGEQVRVSVQLIDATDGTVAWSEQYDRRVDAGFTLQDEITERVVTTLDVRLASGEQARVWRKCLSQPKARDHYYSGMRDFYQMNADSMARARVHFERTAELVPDSPYGPTMVAFCHWMEATRGWSKDAAVSRERAGEWAERAVKNEDADGQAHTVLGNVRLLQERFDEALRIARAAVDIRPGCTNANGFLANVLLYSGEPQAASEQVRKAIRFSPVYPPWFMEILAASYRDGGHPDLAAIAAREALRLAPKSLEARVILATALARAGSIEDARRVALEIMEMNPAFRAHAYAARLPYRDAAVGQALAADLARAGVPD
jgi:adenylate cyclase